MTIFTKRRSQGSQGLSLTWYLLAFMAILLSANTALADWDNDGIQDDQDWGVALTFDMHPASTAVQPVYPTGWEAYWYFTDWQTQDNILDILAAHNAKATFFVSFFKDAELGTIWNSLLDDVVQDHELAWHGREHRNAQTWMAGGGTAEDFVELELSCEVQEYTVATSSGWPDRPKSYGYPYTAGHNGVDTELKKYVGYARGSGGPVDPIILCNSLPCPPSHPWYPWIQNLSRYSYSTDNIDSFFRLQGYWLDGLNGNLNEVKELLNRARNFKRIAVLAAHSFLLASPSDLRNILTHIDCLRDGGTITAGGVECTGGTGNSNNTVYHRFRDLPLDPSRPDLLPVPEPGQPDPCG